MSNLKLSVLPERSHMSATATRALNVLVRLELTAAQGTTRRPPIHLALILDRSGSMQGEKLENTKQCATYFMNWLTRRDFLVVVAYDANVKLLVPHTPLTSKAVVAERIQSLTAGSATNLSGGWMRGLTELRTHQQKGHLHRAVLLTDGLANEGVTDPQQLKEIARKNNQKGFATTTVGFGSDFDEVLLKGVAEAGGGRFHYVHEPEALAKAFQEEFGELATLVGQNLELEIELEPNVTVDEVLTDLPYEKGERGLTAQIGDVRSGDVKQFLFRLRLDNEFKGEEGERQLGRFDARYDSVVGDLEPVCVQDQLKLCFGKEDQGTTDAEVQREIWLAEGARLKLSIARRLEEGEFIQCASELQKHADAADKIEGGTLEELIRDEKQRLVELAKEIERGPDAARTSKRLTHQASQLSMRRGSYRQQAGIRKIKVQVPAGKPEHAWDAVGAAETELKSRGYEAERVNTFTLVLRELIDNALEHGCAGRPDGSVSVECHIADYYARIIVADDGPGFDYQAKLEEEEANKLEGGKRGRGLLVISNGADRVDFQMRNGTRAEAVIERRALHVKAQRMPRRTTSGDAFGFSQRTLAGRDIVVLEPAGHLDAHTFEQFEEQIADLFASGRYKLIVDLSKVDYISSAGAGVFIGSLSEARENGGNIVLVNPTPNVEQVFDLLGLAQVFTMRGSVAEAMEFF